MKRTKTLAEECETARKALDDLLSEIFKALRFAQLVDWLNKKFFK